MQLLVSEVPMAENLFRRATLVDIVNGDCMTWRVSLRPGWASDPWQ